MNNLEFRAWHKGISYIFSKPYLLAEYPVLSFLPENEKLNGIDRLGYDDFEFDCIEQYTGLKDKNGKKIYEGDIVKEVGFEDTNCNKRFGFGRIHSVAWDNIYLQWFCLNNGDINDGRDLQFVNYKYALEVVGNIHENPELLGKE